MDALTPERPALRILRRDNEHRQLLSVPSYRDAVTVGYEIQTHFDEDFQPPI
jgi:hypothetical protein